jgi:hypothetical protein
MPVGTMKPARPRAAALGSERGVGIVEVEVEWRDHHRDVRRRQQRDRKDALADSARRGSAKLGVTQRVAQELRDERAAARGRVELGALQAGAEHLPLCLGDSERSADLLLQREAAGNVVVLGLLAAGFALGGFLQQVGQQQRAFEAQGVETERGRAPVIHGAMTLRRYRVTASRSPRVTAARRANARGRCCGQRATTRDRRSRR